MPRTDSSGGYERSTLPGWDQIVDPLVDMCTQLGVRIDQIKEKFGQLRFYIEYGNENVPCYVYELIANAERYSLYVCECCGMLTDDVARRNIRGGYWIKTLCLWCKGHIDADPDGPIQHPE